MPPREAFTSGLQRRITLPWLLAAFTLAVLIGQWGGSILGALGIKGASPAARFSAMEAYDSSRKKTVDSMFKVQNLQMDAMTYRLDRMNELQLRMAAMSCLDGKEAQRLMQAQMPCGRIIRELEIKP